MGGRLEVELYRERDGEEGWGRESDRENGLRW